MQVTVCSLICFWSKIKEEESSPNKRETQNVIAKQLLSDLNLLYLNIVNLDNFVPIKGEHLHMYMYIM